MAPAPPPSWMLWPDSREGPWYIQFYWSRVEGRIECSGFEITSSLTSETAVTPTEWKRQPRVLTSSVLRRLRFGNIVDDRKRDLAIFYQMASEVDWKAAGMPSVADDQQQQGWRRAAIEMVDSMTSSKRIGGRPPLPTSHYAEVAAIYSKAWQQGRNPTEAVQRHFDVAKSTAAKYVARARDRGFLGRTTKGKAGGIHPEEGEES